ncbi:MAG: succinate dehydrogenase, hydrophobic membrane anchor protein [Pelagibacteraceae bacterium]|jgi:succinate dehydrogenase / fumarate reductase membrane anchor subunit|tara:strand:- start:496 stop:825 length:330 start_codon:yes stop_codon:yes gene_type:complete
MLNATKKWITLKVSGIILIPLMVWFLTKFVFLYDKEYSEVLVFFTDNISKYTIFLFLVVAFIHSALEISEIFEDYIHEEKIKSVANKFLYFFAIIIPLITIFILFSLGK